MNHLDLPEMGHIQVTVIRHISGKLIVVELRL
jgi:hypothetical protein